MKRKLFAILGVTSPLLLLVVCAATTIIMAVGGWWLLGQGEESRIIRIMPVAPLSTPQPTPTQEQIAAQPAQPPQVQETPQSNLEPTAQSAANPNPTATPITPEAVQKARQIELPAGSVNSTTQEGIANRLVIPKINLDAPVILSPIENQTWKVDHLDQSVGHLEGTAPPGSSSNLVLAAHVTLSSGVYGPFAGLSQLSVGDTVFVYDGDQVFEYVIDDAQTVDRTAVEVTYPSQTGQITLITCSNWNSSQGHYTERLVVKGHLAGG